MSPDLVGTRPGIYNILKQVQDDIYIDSGSRSPAATLSGMTIKNMVIINSTAFGLITIDSKNYSQVLIINNQVEERDEKRLYKLFGTTHQIGDWEVEKLISSKPEIIIIGSGQSGVLKVNNEIKQKIQGLGIELKILATPEAVREFNKINQTGRKVNALIHTTC